MGDQVAGARAGEISDAWQALRADETIQFAPVEPPAAQPSPQWWVEFLEWIGRALEPVKDTLTAIGRALGLSGQALMWSLLALAVLIVALLLWRGARLQRKSPAEEPADPWQPRQADALALLEDADRLAAEGRFDEAAHLLLQRSVGQIAAARPGLLEPSSTAREIAALAALPEVARKAFGVIAALVERSLFALRSLSADDWRVARAAYAEFALAEQAG